MDRATKERALESKYYGAYVSIIETDGGIFYGRVSSVSLWQGQIIFLLERRRHAVDEDLLDERVKILSPPIKTDNGDT